MASSFHARLILSHTPSKNSVLGIAIYHKNNLKTVRATARCLDLVGRIGLRGAVVSNIPGDIWLSDEQLDASSDQKFNEVVTKFSSKYSMDVIVSADDLKL